MGANGINEMEIGIKQGKNSPGRMNSVEEDPSGRHFGTSKTLRESHWGQKRLGAGWHSHLI